MLFLRVAKIGLRINLRRADKIELKNVISSRRKLFVFRIMEIKNIYRFPEIPENSVKALEVRGLQPDFVVKCRKE